MLSRRSRCHRSVLVTMVAGVQTLSQLVYRELRDSTEGSAELPPARELGGGKRRGERFIRFDGRTVGEATTKVSTAA